MERTIMIMAAANGFLAVALGAFGAHGLQTKLAGATDFAQRLQWWQTAAQYHLAHALALGLLALVAGRTAGVTSAAAVGGWAMLAGIVLFSGSLYLMTLTGVRALGAVTPVGGLCLLAGWLLLGLAALKV